MERTTPSTELREASELLAMVECLAERYAQLDASGADIPWAGIRHTLRSSREKIEHAMVSVGNGHDYGTRPQMPQMNVHARPLSTSLADRVQQVPLGNPTRARELRAAVNQD